MGRRRVKVNEASAEDASCVIGIRVPGERYVVLLGGDSGNQNIWKLYVFNLVSTQMEFRRQSLWGNKFGRNGEEGPL